MSTSSRFNKTVVFASVILLGATAMPPEAFAASFATTGSSKLVAEPMIEQIQVRRNRRPVAKARSRGNNNAAIAATILGIGVLGIAAAAAASSQREQRRSQYYTDQWGNPVDAYGRPVQVQRPVQYYQQPGYYAQPGYRYQPTLEEQQQAYWQKQQYKAQVRAQQKQQRYNEQQQYQQLFYGHQPVYRNRGPFDPFR